MQSYDICKKIYRRKAVTARASAMSSETQVTMLKDCPYQPRIFAPVIDSFSLAISRVRTLNFKGI
jgi:hypothetical protein